MTNMIWTLAPQGEPVPLNECPPGPFAYNGSLGFRSEYATTLEDPRRHQVDAYCFESGEYFWGGAKGTEARGKLIVQPLALIAVTTSDVTETEARETLARSMASNHGETLVRRGLDDDWSFIKPFEAIRAILALAPTKGDRS